MPLGDSITEGWNDTSRVSYRFWLHKKLQLAGYDFDFVGSQTGIFGNPPLYSDWDQNHEGHSGWFADQIAAQAISWANSANPDIVLLHAGSNDVINGQTPASTANDLGLIIDNLRIANPNITVFLAKIIPATINLTQITALNNLIPGIVTAKNTAQSRVILVDQFAGFDAVNDTWDGIHPAWRGERKMANKWLAGLTAFLPAPPPPAPPSVTYLSDLNWAFGVNGSGAGPIEKDQSVGFNGSDDGGALWLSGVTYPKGLGTHANSDIIYQINGQYARFRSFIGIDDDSGTLGSAIFEVYADAVLIFQSSLMTGSSPTQSLDLDVAGKTTLRLVVTDGGVNGNAWDHGDWAMARLTTQPTVSASSFEWITAPPKVSFTFRGNVSSSIGPSDLLLENLTTSQTIPTASISVSYNTGSNTAAFTFPGFTGGVLPDGNYRATLLAAGVTDGAGNPMPADHVFNFFFLVADANHDGNVNLLDFDILVANFGQSGRNFSQGDFDYNGVTNLNDFDLLAVRFGTTLFPSLSGRARNLVPTRMIDLIAADSELS